MYPQDDSRPGHSTGPRTPAGKAVSAMNSLSHGCRSEKTILRHEDPAEYTALIEGWLKQYNPQTPAERLLVDQTAHAQWFLQRNQHRFDEVEYEKNMNFRTWTLEQNQEYALALRYKTAAERTFLRWFKELESYYARAERKQRMAPSVGSAIPPTAACQSPSLPRLACPVDEASPIFLGPDSPVIHESYP